MDLLICWNTLLFRKSGYTACYVVALVAMFGSCWDTNQKRDFGNQIIWWPDFILEGGGGYVSEMPLWNCDFLFSYGYHSYGGPNIYLYC